MLEHQNTKNIFVKGYTLNWPEEVFVIKEVKNPVPWICMLLMISMVNYWYIL